MLPFNSVIGLVAKMTPKGALLHFMSDYMYTSVVTAQSAKMHLILL